MKNLSLLLLVLVLVSCGKSRSNSKKTTPLNEEEIAHLLENQSFECSSLSGGACPDGLARLFIINRIETNQSAVCTGFLTASNRLVTNHHCLSTLQQCQSTYIAIYHNGLSEVARCNSIITSLDDGQDLYTKTLDVTVLELDRHLAVKPIPLARGTVQPGSLVNAWVIDTVDLFKARITELNCRSLGARYSLEFSSCPAISGNSGSPMLNSSGRAVGVLWGSTLDDSFTSAIELQARRNISALSFATDVKYFRSFSSP